MVHWILSSSLAPVVLSSCLTGSVKYGEPPPLSLPPPNVRIVEKAKDEVWKHLVQKLSQQFFVVNNIDKDSGFVNVSYSGDPEKYCDCGTTTRRVSNARGERIYEYPAARGQTQYEDVIDGYLYGMTRELQLEGRANVFVQEVEPKRTQVSVNVRYVLNGKVNGELAGGSFAQSFARDNGVPINRSGSFNGSFNTGQRVAVGAIICQPTHRFEREILDLLDDLK